MKIKTIDVNAKEWFDRTYGNSYFSMNVTVNYGMKNATTFYVPMQYGYGDHYRDMAIKELQKRKLLPKFKGSFWQYADNKKIICRYNKQENCKKRDL